MIIISEIVTVAQNPTLGAPQVATSVGIYGESEEHASDHLLSVKCCDWQVKFTVPTGSRESQQKVSDI